MEVGERMVAAQALTRASDEMSAWSRTGWNGPWNPNLKPDDAAAMFDMFPASRSAAAAAASSSGLLNTASDLLLGAAAKSENPEGIREALAVKQAASLVQQLGFDVGAGNHKTGQIPSSIVASLRGWVHTLDPPATTRPTVPPRGWNATDEVAGTMAEWRQWQNGVTVRPGNITYPDGPVKTFPHAGEALELEPAPMQTAEQLAAAQVRVFPRHTPPS
jgi:hypothetical protein